MQVNAHQGDTLDALCYRHLGRTAGVTEQVLELNPGLAERGPILPQGTRVTLPSPSQALPVRPPLIQLWD
ncbi:MAG: tail protein X [Silanimonas sp.]|nr:MAG: tail protein X [Silanimonas sp.]